MRQEVVAILCSDIHLSLRPPAARAEEPDWLEAQGRVLKQLAKLQDDWNVPILCAGDIFHKWNSPPELINWALREMPSMYTIPGQHDLPFHSIDQMHRSAYWTLSGATCGVTLEDLPPGVSISPNEILAVTGFPWGYPLTAPDPAIPEDLIKVALVHHYVWIKGHSYPGAPPDAKVRTLFQDGMGWDVIVCGDNHKGFLTTTKSGTVIFNCGGLQRRATDEVGYHPQVGLLWDDGTVEPHFLDISEDIISATVAEEEREDIELGDFLERLKGLQGDSLDFQSAMTHALDEREVSPNIRKIILEAME